MRQGNRDQQIFFKLHTLTELTFRIGDDVLMPGLFILWYPHIGFASLLNEIYTPLVCSNVDLCQIVLDTKTKWAYLSLMKCVHTETIFSIDPVSMINCICVSNPVGQLDLQSFKEDFFFAAHKLTNVGNYKKICMIDWQYATNIYALCGKGWWCSCQIVLFVLEGMIFQSQMEPVLNFVLNDSVTDNKA